MLKNKTKKKIGLHYSQKEKNVAIKKLLKALSLDANVTEACTHAGISRDTYYRWINNDHVLSDRIERSRMDFIMELKQVVAKASRNDGHLAFKVLCARDKNYSQKETVSGFGYTSFNMTFK